MGKYTFKMCLVSATAMLTSIFMSSAMAQDPHTVTPGKLTVAFNGDMPGTGFKDGKLIGVDGEIMQTIADRLDLKIEPALMEWAAEIAAVQAKRVDVMLGMMNWTEAREKAMAFSDPIYYVRPTIAQKAGKGWCKITDLENKNVGTITGFAWVDDLKKINGTKVRLYDTSDAAMRDLLNGRIDALVADPPLIQYAISRNPKWKLEQQSFCEDARDDYPTLTAVANVVIATSRDNAALLEPINQEIKKMWEKCEMKEIAAKYGLDQPDWLMPGKTTKRIGIDRPQGWVQPSCK